MTLLERMRQILCRQVECTEDDLDHDYLTECIKPIHAINAGLILAEEVDQEWREKIKTESDVREKTVAYLFEQYVNGECRSEILDTYWSEFIKTGQYKDISNAPNKISEGYLDVDEFYREESEMTEEEKRGYDKANEEWKNYFDLLEKEI